ncbi:MAG TPA: MBL fold metallo-hydrolase [Gemmatimonadales bacterium]|nr:MBL fold metallo-hydrolase [Gemmatimonadales bacterium]
MPELDVVAIPNGQLVQNCYLVADRRRKLAAIIDPGEEPQLFLAELDTRAWTLTAIWLTHAHVDHIMGVGAIKAATGVPILLHPADRALYDGLPAQGEWMGQHLDPPPPPDADLAAGQILTVGDIAFQVRPTPGHSPGSVSFAGPGVIFGGDVLFNGSIGRTDLPGGDLGTLMSSITREFLTLPDSTIVYSGHGPETTVGVERMTNPFLTGAARLE